MKILIIALSGIGDALMFTPALKLLRESAPDAEIDALVMFSGVRDIYSGIEGIRKIHHWDFLKKNPLNSLRFVLSLRRKYDATINVYPSNRSEYNLISFLIGAKKRAAVKYLRKDFFNLGFLNNIRVTENDSLHNVEENAAMISMLLNKSFPELPALHFPLDKEDEKFADDFCRSAGLQSGDLIIGMHPGCNTLKNHEKRRWEAEKFSELAEKFIRKYNARILIFGGPDEKGLKKLVVSGIKNPGAVAVDADSLNKTAAVMKKCSLFVTNDSSLMHVASAQKLKVAALIGPTNRNYIHPWKTEHRIVSLNLDCSPCFYYSPKPLTCSRSDVKFKCIRELSVDMAFSESEKLLNGKI